MILSSSASLFETVFPSNGFGWLSMDGIAHILVLVCELLKRTLGESSRLLTDKLHERFEIGVKHFAGFVTYDANNF